MTAEEVYYDEPEDQEEEELPDDGSYIWQPEAEIAEDPIVLKAAREKLEKLPRVKPSDFTRMAFMMPTEVGEGDQMTIALRPFSFKERPHLKRIYDTASRRVLLMCARQVEKTCLVTSNILMSDGSRQKAQDVVVGDRVATLGPSMSWMESGSVVWKSHVYRKPCLRIKTRQGHVCEVATTHPMRQWDRWTDAGQLKVGERLAVVRRAGEFLNEAQPDERVKLTAYLIGGGYITDHAVSFTSVPGPTTEDYVSALTAIGETPIIYQKKGTPAVDIRVRAKSRLGDWLQEDDLVGSRSATKFIPGWVFKLSAEQTALFLNRLWSTDGHVKRNAEAKYSIEYCSISKRLVLDVQALLWKFGIPSRIRENWPNIYKKRGELKLAYILRVETRDGVAGFLSQIGALGKSEGVVLTKSVENNNRDTYPIEVNDLLRRILASNPRTRYGAHVKDSLRSAGLRETLEYPPSRDKLRRYFEFFSASPGYDWSLVRQLLMHLSTDLFWDEIVSIEDLGEQDCVDFEVQGTHNFVADGFVTHNSTMLGNISLSYSCIVPGYRTLYVSPSATQTKTFSADRIKEPIETSPVLRQFTTRMLSQNILEKQFINRSKITLRYAFLNADRCLAGSSRVQLLDGSLKTIRELVSSTEVGVIASDGQGRPGRAIGRQARSTGRRQVVSVATDFPLPLVCTPDHRILTGRGWVEAQYLREGDYVAAPHSGHLLGSQTIGEDAAWLIGALIAEGKCVWEDHNGRVISFSNTDEEFILEFEERAARFGLSVGERVIDERYEKPCYTVSVYSGEQGQAFGGKKQELWELGEFGARSTSKHIPQSIFKAPLIEKAAFLQSLFRGDGWCTPEGGYARAGYATSSPRLAEDLIYLLWQLGIRCSLRTRPPSTENAEPSFCLDFSTGETTKLVALIGEYRPGLTYQSQPKRNYLDRVPVSYQWLREYLLKTHGLSTHIAWTRHQIQLRPGNRRDSIGRRVLGSIADKLQDEYLRTLIDPATSWVEVHSVTPAGEEEVFDLTVDPFECFQANGLIVHNCRGIPAWALLLDEIQDILNDNIPVIEACQNHAPKAWRRNIYSGTPKSLDNTIETYWSSMSTMNEWAVPCEGCNTWNILGEKNIGKDGPICEKCGKGIYPQHPRAQWAAHRQFDEVKVPFEGYRINQLMVSWVDWKEIRIAYEKNSRDRFYNETLGISYDSGMRPLTRAQVMACCNPAVTMTDLKWYKRQCASTPVFAGIDWGSGERSYTVLTLAMYVDRKFRVFYMHRFEGEETEPDRQMELIVDMLRYYNVALIGVDYGGGFYPNDKLVRVFGPNKVWKYQYANSPKQAYKWNPDLKRFMIHRSEVMSQIFNAIKRVRDCEFPRWEEFEKPHAEDFLNIYSEANQVTRIVQYKHAVDKPDDSFHSFLYCWLVSMIMYRRPDIIRPNREDEKGQQLPVFTGVTDQG